MHTVTHLGQSYISQPLSGHFILINKINYYFTFWFFTFNITDSIFWLSTASMAFGWFTYWIANSWAMGIITFPTALRMTLINILNYLIFYFTCVSVHSTILKYKIVLITKMVILRFIKQIIRFIIKFIKK